ncbi:hypothetical protein [Nocardia sp. Marseille-Q1738]
MTYVERWTGIESFALQQALGMTVEDFAAKVDVTTSMVYRWRKAGPDARLRHGNQKRLATMLLGLDEVQRRRFEDALTAEWDRWRGPGGMPITSSLAPSALAGHWVTCFLFDEDRCHADISEIAAPGGRGVIARNYPPEPRSEKRRAGFRHEIDAELFDRQLIGRWRNVSDAYYFGALHLAVLPGEGVLDGYYTGNAHDLRVVAQRWKWVRLDEASVSGVDLNDITLPDPRVVYALVGEHTHTDGPLTLSDVVEAR